MRNFGDQKRMGKSRGRRTKTLRPACYETLSQKSKGWGCNVKHLPSMCKALGFDIQHYKKQNPMKDKLQGN
jgi:hypothetical protein